MVVGVGVKVPVAHDTGHGAHLGRGIRRREHVVVPQDHTNLGSLQTATQVMTQYFVSFLLVL